MVTPRVVIQSYKKVINVAPASYGAGSNNIFVSQGKDSVAAGQTGPTDVDVPTGCIIKYIEFQLAFSNSVAVPGNVHIAIQKIHSGQTAIVANVVGGNPQRNQVFHQALMQIGKDQNNSRTFKFKIPKREQRVRDGDLWVFNWANDVTIGMSCQAIYKFYR